ncbi:hypothetical protein PHSY_002889 [Pseudozyma hubeiensis SY62]|uniref:Ricin B lectin domain-containing protein n=1 Tax=Pseudozyma hubeiensis (strain SY62) TaxID=1305764 RepID=R9P255_PSEHS|nr:hypothetical protein PHSY_002889 [Pseudozyma hubeiensis SY62]GAC95314.1 hypothetical protein PHSY_002889 [Pseudozyma hubeiensis SY62]
MKSIFAISTLLCAASFATSVMAVPTLPTPDEPFFVSRMVRRAVPHDDSAATPSHVADTCGRYALQKPQRLQVRSYNDSTTTYLYLGQGINDKTQSVLAAVNPAGHSNGPAGFDFQTCDYQGFTQGYSRNEGGSMGAPIEYWGRVVTNLTLTGKPKKTCLSASTDDHTKGHFIFTKCNDADAKQWFRLQEGIGGAALSYYPVRNHTGYKYEGQTPEYFKVDLHPNYNHINEVKYTKSNSQQYVLFD